ncbi:MAG: endospore germination permease [Eubacteriaceae bacterium]
MDRFSPVHFMFLMLGVGIVSLKTYPRIYLVNGQRNTWIALIISSIIIFFIFTYIIKIWKKDNSKYNKSIVDIYQCALGKKLGNIFLALFILTLFLTLIESSTVEADSMHQNMLIETPKWVFLLFFIVPSIYIVRKNIVAIFTITMIGIVLIMIAGINLGILTISYKQSSLLFPVFENGLDINFFISIIEILGLYGCINITLPFLSKISHNKGKLMKYAIIGLIIIIQIEIVGITGILMTFTPERAISMNYPKLQQTQLVSFFQFLDFGELYVMLQILGGFLLKYMLAFYSILIILRDYNISRRSLKILTVLISIVVLICSIIISTNSFIIFDLLNIYQYICLFNFIIVPLIVFIIIDIKNNFKLNHLRK